jgi:hypothetical protein
VFTQGNVKLGRRGRIWSFSIPAVATCPGRSALCERNCYARNFERSWPSVLASYLRNLEASRRPDFVKRAVAFIVAHDVKVVRVHTAGDFYSPGYARKWLAVMRALPRVRFYLYTRSWRVAAVRPVLERMARRRNVRLWYSCDRETGVPDEVPRGVRLAWMMTGEGDLPPRADLVFRTRRLRGKPARRIGLTLVCPVENGVTGHRTDCEKCGHCWK